MAILALDCPLHVHDRQDFRQDWGAAHPNPPNPYNFDANLIHSYEPLTTKRLDSVETSARGMLCKIREARRNASGPGRGHAITSKRRSPWLWPGPLVGGRVFYFIAAKTDY